MEERALWKRAVLPIFILVGLAATYWVVRSLMHIPDAPSSSDTASPESASRGRPERVLPASSRPRSTSAPLALLSLSGRVQADAGTALQGAKVCVEDGSSDSKLPLSCAISDADGRFVLHYRGASPGTLFASRAGYLPTTHTPSTTGGGAPVVLVMHVGGARVTGTVVDALGGPIAGAWLSASDARAETRVAAISDAEGAFRLDVSRGQQVIVAGADGYSQQQVPVMAPSEGIAFVLTARSSIAGRVVSEGSLEPIAEISVNARHVNGPMGAPRAERTLVDGTFVLNDLPPGLYALEAISERWRSDEQWVGLELGEVTERVELTVRRASQVAGTVLVDGVPCGEGGVELVGAVRAYSPLDGDGRVAFDGITPGHYDVRLHCEGALDEVESLDVDLNTEAGVWNLNRGLQVTGVALTAAGMPAKGVQIDVNPNGALPSAVGTRCTADDRGEFTCSGLAPGEYDVTIGPGVPARSDGVPVTLSDTSEPRVTLQLHAAASLRVRIEAAPSYDRAALVVVATRQGAAGVIGELQDKDVVFAPLALGSYQVALESAPPGSGQHVELTREGQAVELSLALPDPHTLSGRVVDGTGEGVADVWVRASGTGLYGRVATPALTDATGEFSLAGLPPGQYLLEASNQYGTGALDDVASDSSHALVRLRPLGSLSSTSIGADDSTGDLVEPVSPAPAPI